MYQWLVEWESKVNTEYKNRSINARAVYQPPSSPRQEKAREAFDREGETLRIREATWLDLSVAPDIASPAPFGEKIFSWEKSRNLIDRFGDLWGSKESISF